MQKLLVSSNKTDLSKKVLPLRGADYSALRRTISFMGGGAPKKAAGKNEKYIITQLAAVVLDFKEP
jgi:hypothetical protein